MNSTNGTLLNGHDLHGEAELRAGDTIQIGDTQFTFEVA
jgi:pSer/pThr/pTyr-binding forkhead associated (FHA) protein